MTSAIPVRCSTNWAMKPHIGSKVNLLSSFLPVQWNRVKYIWNNSYLYCGMKWKWSMIIAVNFQFKQLERRSLKKKIRASTGFEPMTSAIPVRCSTNWAMKPHIGSKVNLLSSFLPVQWNRVKYIWNNSYLYCGMKWKWSMIIAVNFQFKQLERRSLKKKKKKKKNQGFNGIRTHDLRDTGAMLYQLSYEATHWEQGQFIEFISSRAVKSCEIYMK